MAICLCLGQPANVYLIGGCCYCCSCCARLLLLLLSLRQVLPQRSRGLLRCCLGWLPALTTAYLEGQVACALHCLSVPLPHAPCQW